MTDMKKPNGSPRGKKPDEFHYNPGNMSGKEAGIIKEHDKQKGKENVEHDGGSEADQAVRRDQPQKGR
jgi:hypothetical protein